MKNKTCCFTGHRKLPKENFSKLKKDLENEITNLINQGINYFICGGALGFDTLAALTILDFKKSYPRIKLILILPCKEQTKNWENDDIEVYEYIKANADKYVYTSEHYHDKCMLKRNEHMVNHSEYVIAAWDGRKRSGTFATINYARKLNKNIIILDLKR